MKKYIAIASILLALETASFAALSATLTISGTVAGITDISIASQAGYNALDLVNGETDKLVGIATEKCNRHLGYKVTLSSLNAGTGTQAYLKASTAPANADVVNYSIKYNNVAVTLVSGSAQVTSVTAKTPAAGVPKNIQVTFAGSWLAADTYSDTLTLTIAAN